MIPFCVVFGCSLWALPHHFVCCIFQEVHRIRNEHPEDPCAVMNDRVKGSLKVTRAFGAGFLKQVLKHFTLLVVLQRSFWPCLI